jgi:ribose 5-phosphate isomerase B
MRIAVGADHAGFEMKDEMADLLTAAGHEVVDLGTHGPESVDYPDFAAAVGRAVLAGHAERGVVFCGSGAGAAIAANKLDGIRCAQANDTYTAHQCVEHDDVNVLAMAARVVGPALAWEIINSFIGARFVPKDRYVRRLDKVAEIERDRA